MEDCKLADRLSIERAIYTVNQLIAVCYIMSDPDDNDFENNLKFLENGLLRLKSDLSHFEK